jgi:GntR family transcriptional regulator, transcriptional repressor for pyruvate dehydrogenase complex
VNSKAGGSLTSRTEQALRKRISEGPVKVGDKLPTEKALAAEFGVSRTVIREAVAALRADGLLEAKHGVGYFVSQKEEQAAAADPGMMPQLHFSASMLDILELRMAVETHAAGLAAARKSWAQEGKILAAAEKFARAVADGEPTESSDWEFHKSISEATNNRAFIDFFDGIGLAILPRRALEGPKRNILITKSYLEKSVVEHRAVCEGISRGDVEGARDAMKVHLGGSQIRYRGLLTAGRDDKVSDAGIASGWPTLK